MPSAFKTLASAVALIQLSRSGFRAGNRRAAEPQPAPEPFDPEVPRGGTGAALATPPEAPAAPPLPPPSLPPPRAVQEPPYPAAAPSPVHPQPDRATIVWRAKWFILAAATLVAAATFAICQYLPETYEAGAMVRVSAQSGSATQDAVQASNDLASQYSQLVNSGPVVRSAEDALGLSQGTLDGQTSGGTVGEQNLITVNARASTADEAGERANAVALSLVTELRRANREQAAAYVERVQAQLAPLDRRIASTRVQIARLSGQIAAGGSLGSSAAAQLSSREATLANLEQERDRVASNVAQVSAVVQPDVTVWSEAAAGGQVQPKPVLYTVVAFLLTALVAAQLAVLIGSRRSRRQG
jgi:capsular polysaccharide biosynthesis protein